MLRISIGNHVPARYVYAIPAWAASLPHPLTFLGFLSRRAMEELSLLRTKQKVFTVDCAVVRQSMRAIDAAHGAWPWNCLVILPAVVFGNAALAGNLEPEMVVVQPGEFRMGDLSGSGDWGERPVRKVSIPRAFAIGRYEITAEEYNHFATTTGRPLGIEFLADTGRLLLLGHPGAGGIDG